MPEATGQPDAQAAADAAKAAADAAAATAASAAAPQKLDLTQADLDRIIADRVKRAIPADYEDFKAKAALHDEATAKDQTELQKAQAAEAKAKADGAKALETANARLKRAAILEAAATASAVDAETVVALLSGSEDITVDKDGNVSGAKEAVKGLLKDKPFLAKAATPGASGGEFGGADPKDKKAQIASLEQKANDPKLTAQERQRYYADARALKLG